VRRANWRHLPAIVVAVVFLLPIVYMVTGSLRKAGLPPPRSPELLPSPVDWGNYERAFELVDIPRYALNSLIVAVFAVPPQRRRVLGGVCDLAATRPPPHRPPRRLRSRR
jgi:ABC-type glycerol-3-phosphate transport system permease component